MSVTWNTSGLCRCCHAEGNFKPLNTYASESVDQDCFVSLKDTFDIIVSIFWP